MNLLQKCLTFLSIVLTIELVLFGAFSLYLNKAERASEEAERSRMIVSYAGEASGVLYDTLSTLLIWGVTRSEGAENSFKKNIERPKEIHEAESKIFVNDKRDRALLDSLDMQIEMTLSDLKRIHDEYHVMSLETIALFKHFFRDELEPQLSDILELNSEILKRHGELAQESRSKEAEFKFFIRRFLEVCLVFNILLVVALVIGFSKGITGRLAVISDNISKFWRGEQLNKPISGKDEISKLDLSFHKMAKELSEAREKERAVLDNMPVGILVCSNDGVIESVNPRSEALLQSHAKEIVGKNLSEFVLDSDFDLQEIAATELPRVWKIKSTTGSFPAELSLSHFRHSDYLKYLIGIMDVTAREQLERLKQEFVSVVSHDLRTPLTSIQLAVEVMKLEASLPERSQRNLQNISRDCDRLLRLTKDLLEIATLESGNLRLNSDRYELTEIFEKSLNSVEATATSKGVKLACTAADKQIYCDEDRLLQVLINLLSNAVKYSDTGATVVLRATDDGDFTNIEVIDQGRGIAEEHQKLIFERFKQAKNSDAKIGTGLGLAISKLLVEAHGGRIGVRSKPGEGSTFWFSIPNEEKVTAQTQPTTSLITPDQ